MYLAIENTLLLFAVIPAIATVKGPALSANFYFVEILPDSEDPLSN